MIAPEIALHTSAHAFLKEYYHHRKKMGKRFSFGSWALEIKYPHRSNLRLIITGQRAISPLLEKCLKDTIFKTAKDRKYFSILCEISREKKAPKIEALEKKALALKHQNEIHLQHKNALEDGILESWGLIVLLGFEDIDHTLKGITRILQKEESEILQMLKKLEANKLVEARKNPKGIQEWFANGKFTIFDDDLGNEKLAAYHRQSFNRAIAAQNLPKHMRRFDSLILPLSPGDYASFCEDLKGFIDNQFYKYNSNFLKGRDIYQLQVGLFPAIPRRR